MRPEFSAVPFEARAQAEKNLARLEQRVAAALMTPLASLLAHSPDPDGALNLLGRYAQEAPPEVLGDLSLHPTALTYLVALFGSSEYLAETFLAEPALVLQFARDRNFTRLKSREDLTQDFARFSTTSPDPWFSAQLARFKRRNTLRVVLKDVLGISTVGEAALELSALADVILSNALTFCGQELEKRYGQLQYRDAGGRVVPGGFSVVSLGELGGNELSYSSGISLLFLYSQDGQTGGGSERDSVIPNKQFAARLAQALTRTITQTTSAGQVFRVDLRLRPEGEQGDLAVSLKSAQEYYKQRAREWELQTLIKARHSAGDARLTREFLRGVEPHIYASPAHFEEVESELWAREKISKRVRESAGAAIDLKYHRGGIRDIEFLTQCLQRLYGGHDPWVRSGGTLLALRKLNDKGRLSDWDFAALTSAYEFLRRVEHRTLLDRGQETHRLPAGPEALDRLARRVGVAGGAGEDAGQALLGQLQNAFARVNEIYQRVVHPEFAPAGRADFVLEPPLLAPAEQGGKSLESHLACLDAQAPALARLAREVPVPGRARRSAARLMTSLLTSSDRFRRAQEHPERVRRALELASASEYFADLLIHYPDDLAALDSFEAGLSPAPESPSLQMEMGLARSEDFEPFPWLAEASLGAREKMALLRREYRARALGLGARDLAGAGSVFSSLSRWSRLAVRSISTALGIAGEVLGMKSQDAHLPLVVLGLGRLGCGEFDLDSDADLAFVGAAGMSRQELASWTRVTEKTIEVLSSYTSDGTLFLVNTRLGPSGGEGDLMMAEDAFHKYFAESAGIRELLVYLQARPVAGSLSLGGKIVERLARSDGEVFRRFARHPDLESAIDRVRQRVEGKGTAAASNAATSLDVCASVSLAVSLLRLRHAVALPVGANIAEQVAALERARLIKGEDARALTEGLQFLRSLDHAIRLVTGKALSDLPEQPAQTEAVESLARRWELVEKDEPLAPRLRETSQRVREICRRLVGSA